MDIERFIHAQKITHTLVVQELKQGHKQSCWMWFTFPQITGLGFSETAKYYEIQDLDELQAYVENEYLTVNLKACIKVILRLKTNDPVDVFGEIDAKKLQSSMTLFITTPQFEKLAQQVLDKYFNGEKCQVTQEILKDMKGN